MSTTGGNALVRPGSSPGQRVDVAAWFLSEEQALELEIEAESGDLSAWVAPKPLPGSWLWLRG